jgi:hypothetical protein
MIHYNVWFSFKAEADVSAELVKVRECLDQYLAGGLLHGYRLLRNRGGLTNQRLLPYQVTLEFVNDEQFGRPFDDVRRNGVHSGLHGLMIENVEEMIVETFEDVE